MSNALWIAMTFVVWFVLGLGIARENEKIVKIFLGRPYAISDSGLFWIPFGLAWVRRYTTKVVELHIARRDAEWKVVLDEEKRPRSAGGFITAPGKVSIGGEDRSVGPVNIGVTLSFYFNWPTNKDLLFACVKLLPDPSDERALTDLFQQIVMDEARSVGCKMTYIAIMSNRTEFARLITESTKQSGASRLLIDTGIDVSARVVIDHIDMPKDALEAIDDEEAQRLKAQGVKREAEGMKERLRLEGEGQAAAIRAIKAEGQEAIKLESLRTLREMAKGTSNTIFFPLEAIKQLFGNFTRR